MQPEEANRLRCYADSRLGRTFSCHYQRAMASPTASPSFQHFSTTCDLRLIPQMISKAVSDARTTSNPAAEPQSDRLTPLVEPVSQEILSPGNSVARDRMIS